MLPALVMDGRRWMQHVHVPGQRFEEPGQLHADGVLDEPPTRGRVHAPCCVPGRGRLEHMHVPAERLEERGDLHQLEVPDATAEAQGRGPVLPGRVVLGRGRLQHLRLPTERPETGCQLYEPPLSWGRWQRRGGVPRALPASRGLPEGRRREHVPLPLERSAGRSHMHGPRLSEVK